MKYRVTGIVLVVLVLALLAAVTDNSPTQPNTAAPQPSNDSQFRDLKIN